MKLRTILVIYGGIVVVVIGNTARADSGSHSCQNQECSPGESGMTYATAAEPYFACPTKELAAYTNAVVSLVTMSKILTGTLPNVLPTTGEPEYRDGPDGPNKTRLMLDSMRAAAEVRTFDDAIAKCKVGVPKLRVIFMNIPTDDFVMWVQDRKTKATFWLPKWSLDKR